MWNISQRVELSDAIKKFNGIDSLIDKIKIKIKEIIILIEA